MSQLEDFFYFPPNQLDPYHELSIGTARSASQASIDVNDEPRKAPRVEAVESKEHSRSPSHAGSYAKHWCITSYADTRPRISDDCLYAMGQQEQCPTSGRLHWQVYMEFAKRLWLPGVKERIGDQAAHLECRRGSRESARDYCSKTETAVAGTNFEHGDFAATAKKQGVLAGVIDAIDDGKSLEDIAEEFPSEWIRYNRGIRELFTIKEARKPATYRPIPVTVLWGPAGCGKSKYVHDYANDRYGGVSYRKSYAKDQTSWWDVYHGQELIVIDDYEGEAPIGEILRLLDGYGHNNLMGIKGSHVKLHGMREVIFTSNTDPRYWHCNEKQEKIRALLRRIGTTLEGDSSMPFQYIKREPVPVIELN